MKKNAASHFTEKSPTASSRINAEEGAQQIITLIESLLNETRPKASHTLSVTLDSQLDKELGLDSLSKVELIARIEKSFSITLADEVLAQAQTPRDILDFVLTADRSPIPAMNAGRYQAPVLDAAIGLPHQAKTLIDVLHWHVSQHPDRTHIFLYDDGEKAPQEITYRDLLEGAKKIAMGLGLNNLVQGDTVAIMLPTGRDYLYSFYGILLAGGIPIPIYPPANLFQLEDHVNRHVGILSNAQTTLLITLPEAKRVAGILKAQVETLRSVISPDELQAAQTDLKTDPINENDIAFIQYTSGSTGQPKGVILTHRNLLENIRAMGKTVNVDSTDVFVSWLPLYHDMGLIGAWFSSLYFSMPLVLMSPLAFLKQPSRWLRTISNHGGTISAAPNFAFELCTKKIPDDELEHLDLSSLRFLFNGAEPVSAQTLKNFSSKFEKYGLRSRAVAPVYGLAEVAVGLAFPPPERGPKIDLIQREAMVSQGLAIPIHRPAQASSVNASQHNRGHLPNIKGNTTLPDGSLEIVACGQPLPGYQVRIVDRSGRELPDRQQGRLEFKGPSATQGYYRNEKATSKLKNGDWLDSGDLAYSAEGDIYLTSRVKDIIIRAGRNIYPHQLEESIGQIDAVRKGCVAVFGATDNASHTEKLVVVAETRLTEAEAIQQLRENIIACAIDVLGTPVDQVVIAPPHTVLKTSSGKIRRSAIRELYENGTLLHRSRSVLWQYLRLFINALNITISRSYQRGKVYLYAGYVKSVFWIAAPIVWLLAVISPNARTARWIMHHGARLFLSLCRVPVDVKGYENIQEEGPCVIVSNHTSYLDGIIIAAVLPIRFGFVAKGELKKNVFARLFLKKIEAIFVERFDKQRGVADARKASHRVKQSLSLFFFPEGTLSRRPGLLPFYMGAFVAATEAGVPITPLVIKGARSILRSGSWFPQHGKVSVIICPLIKPESDDWSSAVKLSKLARAAMLEQLDEPDLAAEINNSKGQLE